MTEQDEAMKRYYSEWWENPCDIRNVVFDGLNEYVKQRIPPGRGKRALDIGSGHGKIVAYLVEKGYQVTAVEFNQDFAKEIKGRFPGVRVIQQDIRNLDLSERYDLVTCIELVQNLPQPDLLKLLAKLAGAAEVLLINISNRQSMHGKWVSLRGFMEDFVFGYTPAEFDRYLVEAGFSIVHRRGVGLFTPLSLFKGFRGKFIPVTLARIVNRLDICFTKMCHLYYIEATGRK